MIDISHQFENEQRARHLTMLFLVDAITEPGRSFYGAFTPPNPAACLAYLIQELAGGDPVRLHKIARCAWADYAANPDKGRWPCLVDASRIIL